MSTCSSDGIPGIHKQMSTRDDAQTHTNNQPENVSDGGVNVTFFLGEVHIAEVCTQSISNGGFHLPRKAHRA